MYKVNGEHVLYMYVLYIFSCGEHVLYIYVMYTMSHRLFISMVPLLRHAFDIAHSPELLPHIAGQRDCTRHPAMRNIVNQCASERKFDLATHRCHCCC